MAAAMAMAQAEQGEQLMCRVEELPGRGRVLTAARDFEAGELVLRETPSLAWSTDEVEALFPSFLEAAPEVQKAVLEMAMPSIDADLEFLACPREREELRAAFVQYSALRQAIGEGPTFK